MTQPDPTPSALARELASVVRRHDPSWTDPNSSDPGVTLLGVQAWLAGQLDFYASRTDPYRNFKFRVSWDGAPIAGVTRISALRRSTEIVEYRDGASPHLVRRNPGRLVYEPITFERPTGTDSAFESWADQVRDLTAGYRKPVRIEVLDPTGVPVLAYDVHGCWPSAYQALPDLSAGASARLVETLTLVPEGWQRDKSVHP